MKRELPRKEGLRHVSEFIADAIEPLLLRRCKSCGAPLGRGLICPQCGARNHPRRDDEKAAA